MAYKIEKQNAWTQIIQFGITSDFCDRYLEVAINFFIILNSQKSVNNFYGQSEITAFTFPLLNIGKVELPK